MSKKVTLFDQMSTASKKKFAAGRAPFYGSNSKTISYPPMSPSMSYRGGREHDVISQASNQSRLVKTAVQIRNHPNTTNEGMLWPDLNG